MVVARGVRNRDVIKVPRVELHIVRLMVVVGGVSISGAQKVLKVGRNIVLHMVVGDGVGIRLDAAKLLGANRVCVLNMAVERGVRSTVALVVQKDRWVCAYLMEEVGGASSKGVTRELREALCTAKLMVVENVVFSPVALRVLKVVPHFVKPTVEENDAFTTVVGFALKACTEGLIFA